MDVCLVLTHRCNLDCTYCYAGEHYKRDITPDIVDPAVDLLFSDGSKKAQLSFFGGEPFLAFDSMVRSVELARRKAEAAGGTLLLQCTTNGAILRDEHIAYIKAAGIKVTVSFDGVREAHDENRPQAGGKSSFNQVLGGLQRLLAAGIEPGVMMVVTPGSAPFLSRSVSWFWNMGIKTVRANLELGSDWTEQARLDLKQQVDVVAWEMTARRMSGQEPMFDPFAAGFWTEYRKSHRMIDLRSKKRPQVVVATGGNLYPCAPMVAEDRDDGPEAANRIGHVSDGPEAVMAAVRVDGAGCSDGKNCACAAFLETGDRAIGGPVGYWFGTVCGELGARVVRDMAMAKHAAAAELPGAIIAGHHRPNRRPLLIGLLAAGGVAAASMWNASTCDLGATAGEIGIPVQMNDAPDEPGQLSGGMTVPPKDRFVRVPVPEREPEREQVDGGLAPPPVEAQQVQTPDVEMVLGDIGFPTDDSQLQGIDE